MGLSVKRLSSVWALCAFVPFTPVGPKTEKTEDQCPKPHELQSNTRHTADRGITPFSSPELTQRHPCPFYRSLERRFSISSVSVTTVSIVAAAVHMTMLLVAAIWSHSTSGAFPVATGHSRIPTTVQLLRYPILMWGLLVLLVWMPVVKWSAYVWWQPWHPPDATLLRRQRLHCW